MWRIFAADFETTVYEGQTRTDVWSSAFVELFKPEETAVIQGNIGATYEYFAAFDDDILLYYHNLKFDGSFWVDYLLHSGFTLAWEDEESHRFAKNFRMAPRTFKTSISKMGQWYEIVIKTENNVITIRDSLKLLPFPLKKIAKDFKTKHKKLDMEYTGLRYPDCPISDDERAYILNDIYVLKEALEFMSEQNHLKMTIGACCMDEFIRGYGKQDAKAMFPNLYEIDIDGTYGAKTAGDYIHNAYRGGWCYVVPEKRNIVYGNGVTADVNSLYPSVMHSESGNRYPVGTPTFIDCKKLAESDVEFWLRQLEQQNEKFFYVRFKTRFYIKDGYLPFIQIKNTFRFLETESLKTSDYIDSDGKAWCEYWKSNEDGTKELVDTAVTLTMTMYDFRLFKKHYNLVNFELLDMCYFNTDIGIFDRYIDKYKEIKMNSTGAMRALAKLFLNNLYGKMATSTDSSFKYPGLKPDGAVGLCDVEEHEKEPGYIAIGAAITSYARCFTITAAQANYYGEYEPGFIYADTDSIHCNIPPDSVRGIKVDNSAFCCWKLESYWDKAIFVRQKTYIEHVTHEDGEPVTQPYYNVKCAGMPKECKIVFSTGLDSGDNSLKDFKTGLQIPGKLIPRRIPGGVLLVETTFTMK